MEREYEVIVEDEDFSGVDDEDYDAYMADIYYEDKILGLI